MTEVAARAGLDRSAAFPLIHTLVSLGYIYPVSGGKRFRLGLRCLELGFLALSSQDLRAHAAPLLRERVPSVADTGLLGTLDGPDVVCLVRVNAGSGQARHNVNRRPGGRAWGYDAVLGRAQLAFLPEARQIAILESADRAKLSGRTVPDLNSVLQGLRQVRAQGFAVSDGDSGSGRHTVAAPVLDVAQAPIAGVGFTIRAGRTAFDEFVAVAMPEVVRIAEELTRAVKLSAGAIRVTPPLYEQDGRGRPRLSPIIPLPKPEGMGPDGA